ncbi:hypothetical protein RB601_000029 [Gaeumannomyces tritici]
MSQADIIYAYRRLYRAGLQAVMYSQPARTVVRDKLREAFRDKSRAHLFDRNKALQTVNFLRSAARERGLAHRIVRGMVFVAWHRRRKEQLPFHMLKLKKPQMMRSPWAEITSKRRPMSTTTGRSTCSTEPWACA